ncbi:hypothetical protein KXR53_07315 [Inquilinus limosus]|uniref:hypothetical protein n=1 Tax=Inquilinus limosus TaxID=171674 RepID=UPI003F14AA16
MNRGILSCAAGLLALAAFYLPARAEQSRITFTSGPFAGTTAEEVERQENGELATPGIEASEAVLFRARGMVARVRWWRWNGYYSWWDATLNEQIANLQRRFKPTGVAIIGSDRIAIQGFDGQFRSLDLTGTPLRCGVFKLRRGEDHIVGVACRPDGQAMPVSALVRGLSIEGVIGP